MSCLDATLSLRTAVTQFPALAISASTWQPVAILAEKHSSDAFARLAFHPRQLVLATLGENDKIIRVWDLDDSSWG